MTVEVLNQLPLDKNLKSLSNTLKEIEFVSKSTEASFNRKIFIEGNIITIVHEIKVSNQIVFRNIYRLNDGENNEYYIKGIEQADTKFLTDILTFLLLHKLPSVAEMIEYQRLKGLRL